MAGRGRTSFQKRQKEQLRLERRQQKEARKQERQTNKQPGDDIGSLADIIGEDLAAELGPANDQGQSS